MLQSLQLSDRDKVYYKNVNHKDAPWFCLLFWSGTVKSGRVLFISLPCAFLASHLYIFNAEVFNEIVLLYFPYPTSFFVVFFFRYRQFVPLTLHCFQDISGDG